jgi:hypothetical protein
VAVAVEVVEALRTIASMRPASGTATLSSTAALAASFAYQMERTALVTMMQMAVVPL